MSATRKILLALSVLLALLGSFQVYDLATSDYSEGQLRDRERNQRELRALEAGEPPPSGAKLDEHQRAARIADLRSWTKSSEEMAALDREHDQERWRNAIGMLLLAGGLTAAVVAMGRKNGPRALVRLGQLRPGVIVAVLTGLLAGALLIGFTRVLIEELEEVSQAEQHLDEVQSKLEGFEFDANGNVPKDKRFEFESVMSAAKYAPERVVDARGRRTLALLIVLASTLVLGLCAYFGRRSWLRSPRAADPAWSGSSPPLNG